MVADRDWFADEAFWKANYAWMFPEERFANTPSEIDSILQLVALADGSPVLDLCCGPGRHTAELARRGYRVTAVDRTQYLLNLARERVAESDLDVAFVESDMRDYVAPDSFDLVINLFTSFGYFEDPEDDRRVARNVLNSLRPGGAFVLEMMGKEILARIYRPRDWTEQNGAFHLEERRVSDNWGWMNNRWIIIENGATREFTVSHRLFSGVELRELLKSVGFSDVRILGSLDAEPYGPEAKRLVAVALK